MCDGYSAAMAAMAVAGTYAQQQAQSEAADKQQSALNAALEQEQGFSKQAETKALENAQEYDPTDRTQRFEQARTTAGDSLAQQLVQARDATPATAQSSGRLSKEFDAASAKATADQTQQSVDMARLMGNMRGANDMLTREGYTNADYASQLGTIGRNGANAFRAAQPGINAAGRVDSGQMLLGGLASSLGASALGSSLGSYFGATPSLGSGITAGGGLGSGALGAGTLGGMETMGGLGSGLGGGLGQSSGGMGVGLFGLPKTGLMFG